MNYYCLSENVTLKFASDELKKYGESISGDILQKTTNVNDAQILLGTFTDLAFYIGNYGGYDKWNDSILIKTINGRLVLSGSNPRCVLFAVYDYLEKLGCKWIEPGPEGDYLPTNMLLQIEEFDIYEKADHQYRGLSAFPRNIEYAKMLIDWMPKRKYNLYFLEGYPMDRPGDRWSIINGERPLQHIELILSLKGKSWDERSKLIEQQESVVDEARKRGFLIERYGHGWNYGLKEHYAFMKDITLEEAHDELRAKGCIRQHDDTGGVWFQICMSRPEVKDIYVEHIVDYLKRHKDEVDIAAIWLGDGYDNSCQCEECVKKPFSDWYLEILRDVATEMRNTAPKLKIEGIIYLETLEPPTRRFLDGLDNVVVNFAPWNRCYVHALDDKSCCYHNWKPDYRKNKSHDNEKNYHPLNADYYEAYQGWRKTMSNICYFFEYFVLYPGPDRSFLTYNCSNLIRDIKEYKRLGFDGCISCQNATPDFPLNLVTETVGQVLWDCSINSDLVRDNLVKNLFGEFASPVLKHLNEMYKILTKVDVHKNLFITESVEVIQEIVRRLEERIQEFDDVFPVINLNGSIKSRVIQMRIAMIIVYLQYREALAKHKLQKTKTCALIKEFIDFLEKNRQHITFRNIDEEIKRLDTIKKSL